MSSARVSSIDGISRDVIGTPSSSTTIHRRSPARPHGSSNAESSGSPRHDFTG